MRAVRNTPVLILALLAVAAVSAALLAVLNGRTSPSIATESSTSIAAIPVDIDRATREPITETVHAVGTLEANESVMIRPEIPGLVRRVHFANGQPVEEGTILIELDDRELQAQTAQAAAQLKIARLTYERMKRLFATRSTVVSPQQVDEALSELQSAEAAHTLFATRLKKTKIAAPFSGTVGIRRFSPGDVVQAGQDLVNLEDLSLIHLDFKLPEIYLGRLAVGLPLQVRTEAYPSEVFTGEVAALDPRIEASTRAIRVRAHVPNPHRKLQPGLFATVTVVLQSYEEAVTIAEEAVVHQGKVTYVYHILDDTAHRTEVTLGIRERHRVQVVAGLREGDLIVRTGQHKLADGARISHP